MSSLNHSLSRDQVRNIDACAIRELGIPGALLMENAARGLCDILMEKLDDEPHPRVLIVCGTGNNGGDGLALARLLSANGRSASTVIVDDGKLLQGDAELNERILMNAGLFPNRTSPEQLGLVLGQLNESDWVVDALLGTGLTGPPREPYRSVIHAINRCSARVLSVDLPSGMNCDTGEALETCVKADETVSFVARKRGFDHPAATSLTGRIHVCHIGLPLEWLSQHINAS
ncbi:MAG: NAD(P)H-hydrate epimerase [Planctomycetaceae bacterium]|nr:NAD(P)H-hydrate epimerase [Planctomycetaceae bacterium]